MQEIKREDEQIDRKNKNSLLKPLLSGLLFSALFGVVAALICRLAGLKDYAITIGVLAAFFMGFFITLKTVIKRKNG